MKQNIEIRKAIDTANIKYWQVADNLKITDGNFSRKLRKELSKEDKQKILSIVEKLKKENNN